MKFASGPGYIAPTRIQDSGPIICPPGVWTQLIAATAAASKWVQLNIQTGAVNTIELGTGPLGFENTLVHMTVVGAQDMDIFNCAFEIPAGTRMSVRPSNNLPKAELHICY